MRISDWSSDVCSSDLAAPGGGPARRLAAGACVRRRGGPPARCGRQRWIPAAPVRPAIDRSGSKRVHPELAALDLAGAQTRQRLFRLLARDRHVAAGGVDVDLADRVLVQAGLPGPRAAAVARAHLVGAAGVAAPRGPGRLRPRACLPELQGLLE